MDSLIQDLRYALKLIWKEKAFTLTVLVTLAVCIGANSAMFSVVHRVLLAPLPYADSGRLVTILNSYPNAGVPRASNGATDYFIRRERIEAFEAVAQYTSSQHTTGDEGATERVRTMRVTPSFFPLLGVSPILGRHFHEEEMDPGNEMVAILSHDYWEERFASDPTAVGAAMRVDGRSYQIVGVLPAGFRAPETQQPRFYVPIAYALDQRGLDNWHSNSFSMIARLRPGVTVERAVAENDRLNAALISEWPIPGAAQLLADAGYHTQVHPLHADMVRDIRPTLYLLWGGVGFVLLIGCVNIANIILARSQVRMRETATRLALGGPRWRIARQVLVHAVLLAAIGGLLGLGVGAAGIKLLGALGASEMPRGAELGMDITVLAYTLGVAVVAGILFGAIPAVHVLRRDLRTVLNSESRGGSADRRTLWVRTSLVTSQVTLAFLLLIGAGLLLVSFRSAMAVEPGFRTENLLTASVSLPSARYPEGGDREQFVDAFLAELGALPGVQNVGVTTQVPFGETGSSSIILPEGYTPPPGESILSPYQTWVAGDYFDAMGIPLVEGRVFETADGREGSRVVILDRWLAQRYYGDESPLGKRMVWGTIPAEADEDDHYTIVGVVGTVLQNDLTASPAEHAGAYYFPYRQNRQGFITLAISTSGPPESLVPAVRDRLTNLDSELPLFAVESMRARLDESLMSRRASMVLLLTFAGVALFLAMLGIYGVLAYTVAQRTREIGIRMALGSTARQVFMLVVTQGARVVAVGLLVGGVAAMVLGRLIRSLLYGVEPLNPMVMLTVAITLAVVALAASALPAWRAMRIEPVRALVGE